MHAWMHAQMYTMQSNEKCLFTPQSWVLNNLMHQLSLQNQKDRSMHFASKADFW